MSELVNEWKNGGGLITVVFLVVLKRRGYGRSLTVWYCFVTFAPQNIISFPSRCPLQSHLLVRRFFSSYFMEKKVKCGVLLSILFRPVETYCEHGQWKK